MKIFPVENIREADAYTIENEPISSLDLMERASLKLFQWLKDYNVTNKTIQIFCGLGNNGGDGLALARMLINDGTTVKVNIIRYSDKSTDDFKANLVRLEGILTTPIVEIKESNNIPVIHSEDIVIDAIFGSGLTRPISGMHAQVINNINDSGAITIAIDMPSGLFADKTSSSSKGAIINADYTLSFQFPKLAFLIPDNETFVGNWEILDIGLSNDYIVNTSTNNSLITIGEIKPLLRGRSKFSHKGTYGHALVIAGSYGKMGAAIITSKACLKSGVGLLHTHVPKSGISILQTASPETMLSIDRYDNYFSEVPNLTPYNVIGVGPGLGMEHQSKMALKLLIQNSSVPIVFDADALNILAENPTWLAFLPKNSVLTPHPKEFQRLVGGWSNDFEKLDKLVSFAKKHGIYIVLKGANTCVCFPDGQCFFNSTGNPGMATAGSGDVLTGIITGLIASGYSSGIAAIIGVYIHGLSGDITARKMGMESITASEIINNLGKAFLEIWA